MLRHEREATQRREQELRQAEDQLRPPSPPSSPTPPPPPPYDPPLVPSVTGSGGGGGKGGGRPRSDEEEENESVDQQDALWRCTALQRRATDGERRVADPLGALRASTSTFTSTSTMNTRRIQERGGQGQDQGPTLAQASRGRPSSANIETVMSPTAPWRSAATVAEDSRGQVRATPSAHMIALHCVA